MPTTDAPSRQHKSLNGKWVACYASERPCPRSEHRDTFPFERKAFMEDIEAQIRAREATDLPVPVDAQGEIADEAMFLLGEYGEMEFANHADAKYGDWITLEEMADGDKARNNCAIVTAELLERIDQDQFGGEVVGEITIEAEDGQHVAISTFVEGEWYVVDFTLRQYGQDLAFPYVGTQQEWKATVERATDLDWSFEGDLDEDEGEE